MGFLARFRSSLTYPIAATLVLVTVVPMVLVGLLLSSYNREQLEIAEKKFLSRQAGSLADETSLFISGHQTVLASTARALAAADQIDVDSFTSILQGIGSEPGRAFIYLQIIPRNISGAYVRSPQMDVDTQDILDEAMRQAHEKVMEGDRIEEIIVDLPEGEAPKVLFAYPLRSRGSGVWGSLHGVLDLVSLQNKVSQNMYTGYLVSVLDRSGVAVVSSRPNLRKVNLSASPLVQNFLNSPQRITLAYDHPVDEDSGEVLGSMAPVPVFNWGMLMERPTAAAYAPVRVMQTRTFWSTAIAALVALGIGSVLSRRLINPLQNLASTTSQIAEGNLAVRATVSGEDEIALLGSNFNDMASNIEALVRKLKQALRQNQELFLETIRTLAAAIDAKDPYTRGHSERVSSYSMAISRHLGLSQDEVFRVHIAAILHDVGKLGIRESILNKPGGLSDDEFEIMRQHPAIGAQIMSPIRMLKDIIPGIRNHHETWDGTGYPDHLEGEEIPMVARIIGVADTFDAMTTTRPYQQAMTLEYVLNKMRSMSGSRFDPGVIDAFMAAVEAGDISPPMKPVEEHASTEVS
jgi:HD-GYP domain-containing protein (c-di-GMP phosphodiesterase class II)